MSETDLIHLLASLVLMSLAGGLVKLVWWVTENGPRSPRFQRNVEIEVEAALRRREQERALITKREDLSTHDFDE